MHVKGATLLAAGLCVLGQPAKAADSLSCMAKSYAQPEQAILDRNAEARRGDDALSRAVYDAIEARGRTCAYLHGWSQAAQRLAVAYRWTSEQWFNRKIVAAFTADQQEKFRTALAPKKAKLVSSFSATTDAVAHGQDAPAPVPGVGMYDEYHDVLKAAGIPRTNQTEQLLDGWLYTEGFTAALKQEFETA